MAWIILLLAVIVAPHRSSPAPLLTSATSASLLIKEASAAPNPPTDPPTPPPLDWPAANPILPSEAVGYLPGSGTVTATGEYTYTLPIDVPAGRMGVAPVLSLAYSSRGGNGLLGVGWSLAGASEITRCGKTLAQDGIQDGIDFTTGDSLCLDGRRLVLVSGCPMQDGAEYRTEQDSFSRVVTHGDHGSGPEWIEVTTKEGTVRTYTPVLAKRVLFGGDTSPGSVSVAWILSKVHDFNGNAVLFHYETSSSTTAPYGLRYRLDGIEYTARVDHDGDVVEPGQREVRFFYEDRPDPLFLYVSGVRREMPDRLRRIVVHAPYPGHVGPAASYWLTYTASTTTGKSLLVSVARDDGDTFLWTRRFEWAQAERPSFQRFDLAPQAAGFGQLADLDGDGRDEFVAPVWNDDGDSLPDAVRVCRTPPGDAPLSSCLTDTSAKGAWKPGDIDGDGRAEVLSMDGASIRAMTWDGAHFVPAGYTLPQAMGADPGTPTEGIELVDVDGDARLDAVVSVPREDADSATTPSDGMWAIRRNTGGAFGPAETLCAVPVLCPLDDLYKGRAAGADLNGDGRAELLASFSPSDDPDVDEIVHTRFYSVGTTDSGAATSQAAWFLTGLGKWLFLDLNGDGLPDAFHAEGGGLIKVRYNTGTGFGPTEEIVTDIHPHFNRRRFQVIDIDADGRQDVLSLSETGPGGVLPYARLHLWRGDHFDAVDLDELGVPAWDPDALHTRVVAGDFNGDGLADLYVRAQAPSGAQGAGAQAGGGTQGIGGAGTQGAGTQAGAGTQGTASAFVLQQKWAPNDVITEVSDEGAPGPREKVFYSAAPSEEGASAPVAYPARRLRGGFLVASEHWTYRQDEPSTPSTARRTAYTFEDGRTDLRGRGSLGFGAVRALDLDTFAETITRYDHTTSIGGVYPYGGMPAEIWQMVPILLTATDAAGGVVLPAGGAPITARIVHTVIDHEVRWTNGGLTYFVYSPEEHVSEWEQHVSLDDGRPVRLADGSASQARTRAILREVDDFGNETHVSAATLGGASCSTTRLFDNLTVSWQPGLLRDTATACAEPDRRPSEAREVHYDYDTRGRVKKVIVEPQRLALTSATEYQRDSAGHVIKTTYTTAGELPRHTYTAYDEEGVYPRAVWNDLGHAQRQLVHPALGVVVLSEDVNGVQTLSSYDGFGRLRSTKTDGGIGLEVSYAADDPTEPTGIVITRTAEDGGEAVTRLDSEGRAVEVQSVGFGGEWVHEAAVFNRFGQRTRVSRPGVGQPSAYGTTITYDTLGRVVRAEGPDGATTTYRHSMFGVTATDPKGRIRRLTRDLDDRVTESADWNDDHWIVTTYRYAAWGLLNTVIDAAGNRTDIHYDTLGRRVRLDDPDRGTSTWDLNGWGEVVSSTDGLGDMTLYERDRLGRVVWQLHDTEGVTTFDYDGAPYAPGAQGAAGALTRAVSPEGVATQLYFDQLGRPIRTSWRLDELDEEELSVDREYDSLGRLETLRYPEAPGRDRFSVWYRYNAQGYLDKVSDVSDGIAALPLYTVTGRNAEGLLTGAAMGNGVVEARGYDPVTGRVAAIEALGGTGPLYSIGYQHDLAGDIESRTDHVTGREERFSYDALDRLWKWKVTHKGLARELTYGHDDLGNLESVSSPEGVELFHHDGQAVQSVLRLPHALTSRSAIGTGSGAYWYDDKGRQVSGGGREIEWRSFDQPAVIYQGGTTTTFGYDAFGARVSKVHEGAGGVETTLTLGGLYERRTKADGAEHLFTVHGPDGVVAQIVYRPDAPPADRDEVLYLQGDVQGSVGLVIDSDGHEVERRMFDPFGLVTDASGVALGAGAGGSGGANTGAAGPALGEVKLGFTGHRHDDELGVIYARGRVYDPGQKRFLTADPTVPDPLFGQSLNRYQYCFGNPVRFSDPTGFDPEAAVSAGSINGVETGGLGGWIIGHRPGPAAPPSGDAGGAGGGGGGLGALALAGAAPGAVPFNGASPSPPSSTTETGNKPSGGPAADAPGAQAAGENTLMKARKMDPRVVRQTAAEQWFEAVSRMDSGADKAFVIVGTAHVATQGVQRGGAMFGVKAAGGALLNVGTLGAVATYTIWSEVHQVATSDDPLHEGAYAVAEMFDPAHIAITRGIHFYKAMQDFQFEDAGESLGEMEFVAGAVVAGSAPKMGGGGLAAGESAKGEVTSLNPRGLLSRQGPAEMTRSRIDRMAKAMKEGKFDWDAAGPIRVAERDGTRIIIDGHHRAAAARRAGLGEVPVKVEPVTDEVWSRLLMEAAEAAGR